jgi:hypothetical protein
MELTHVFIDLHFDHKSVHKFCVNPYSQYKTTAFIKEPDTEYNKSTNKGQEDFFVTRGLVNFSPKDDFLAQKKRTDLARFLSKGNEVVIVGSSWR